MPFYADVSFNGFPPVDEVEHRGAIIQRAPTVSSFAGGAGSYAITPFLTPWNLQDRFGRYHRAEGQGYTLAYLRSHFGAPPYAVLSHPTLTHKRDHEPRMAVDHRGRIRLLFTRKFTLSTPASLSATPTGSTSIGLTWTNVSVAYTHVRIWRRPRLAGFTADEDPTPFQYLDAVPSGTASYSDGGLDAMRLYEYRLDAILGDPTTPDRTSDDSDPAEATTDP